MANSSEALGKKAYDKDSTDLLLVGKTGNGKSALGNTILQMTRFVSKNTTESVTNDINFDFSDFEGRTIKVVDGPGLGDTGLSPIEASKFIVTKMSEAICTSTRGFHAILLVVRYGGRFTKEDTDTVCTLKKIFGEKFITDHAILVMTWGDCFSSDAEDTGQTFEEWCDQQKGVFQQLYTDVQKRAILFDNKTKERRIIYDQLRRLLDVVDKMGARYTTEMFDEAKRTRDRVLRAERRLTLNEDAIREAGIITRLLSRVDQKNPQEGLQQLQDLMKRSDDLGKNILDQDQGTNSLSVAIKMSQNLKATTTEQFKEMQRVLDKMHQDQPEKSGAPEPEYKDQQQGVMMLPTGKESPDAENDKQGESEKQREETVKKHEKDRMDEKKHQEHTMKLAEKKAKVLQDLKNCMAHAVAEREKDYQEVKGESRAAWMKAAPELFNKIWSRFGTLRSRASRRM